MGSEMCIRDRSSSSGAAGERTDLLVTAITKSETESIDVIEVIIEAKGCWNPEVQSAMKTQLVDRYLHENQCRHGLYLVGWFLCGAWDESDPRKGQTPWTSIDDARSHVEAQAQDVSRSLDPSGIVDAYVLDCALR